MSKKTSIASGQKKTIVKNMLKLMDEYPIVGAVNMEGMPAAQLQRMTAQLRGKIELIMTKRRLMLKAIEKAKEKHKGIEKIEEYLRGMPALLFTKENPFGLFKTLKKSKSKAPAKAGQLAPNDIIIPAGPTPFAPGPVISELGALGIKSGVEGGKVAIKSDSLVCKEGEPIKAPLASLLTRLGIEPMEVGLDLIAVYEKGTIYPKKVLDIDEEQFMKDLMLVIAQGNALAMEAGIFTADIMEPLIGKAFRAAKAVALEGNILSADVIEEVIGKAERAAQLVKQKSD